MLDKVLIIASSDASQEPAFMIMDELRASGYSADICRAPTEDSKIKPDRLLTETTEIVDYKGVIFLDDGGDFKSAVGIAARANDAELMVAGYRRGCLVLVKAKVLKGKYVCMGLPRSAYKGAKMVKSKAVRSDNIVTCAGGCSDAFSVLLLDCLGGGVKKVVKSWVEKEVDNSEEVTNLLSSPTKVAELVEPICGKIQRAASPCDGCNMIRREHGWEADYPGNPEKFKVAKMACIAIQSGLQDPDGAKRLNFTFAQVPGGNLQIQNISSPPSGTMVDQSKKSEQDKKLILEREMAHEGIFVQPDGRIAVRGAVGTQVFQAQQVATAMEQEVLAAFQTQLGVANADLDENRRAAKVAARAKHRLNLIEDFLGKKRTEMGKTASGGVGGVSMSVPHGNIDISLSDRVWSYEEGEEDRDEEAKYVHNQARYHPETDEWGFFHRKPQEGISGHNEHPDDALNNDPKRDPTSWEQVLEGDSMNNTTILR